jgi:uncharacterized protein
MSRTRRSQLRTVLTPAPRARQTHVAALAQPPDDSRPGGPRNSRDKSVRIGRTPVGKGVFAQKRYRTTDIIGEILGDVINDPNYGSHYCMAMGDGRVLEPHAPFRYVNHSCDPNCEFDCFDLTGADASPTQRHVFLIALREIRPGEELTIDYNWPAAVAIPCRCGSPTCRGWIVDPGELALLAVRPGP